MLGGHAPNGRPPPRALSRHPPARSQCGVAENERTNREIFLGKKKKSRRQSASFRWRACLFGFAS